MISRPSDPPRRLPDRPADPQSRAAIEALDGLAEVTRGLGLDEDLDVLLDDLLQQTRRLIGVEHCVLTLYDPATDRLAVRGVLGYGDESDGLLGRRFEIGEGLAGWAAEKGVAVRVGNVEGDERYLETIPGMRSHMAVPLVAGGELAGVIAVESPRPDAFDGLHERLLTILGSHAGLAIAALRAKAKLQGRIRRLDALNRIIQLASVSVREEFDRVLSTVLDVTREVIPEGRCAILLLDPDSRCLCVRASDGYQPGVGRLYIPLGKGITGKAAADGTVQVVDDLDGHPDYIPGVRGARSEVALPLVAEGQVIGVLNVESTEPGAFDEELIETLKLLSRQVAVVLRTAQLHDESRRLSITDPLTGLYNRRYFVRQLEESLRRAQRYDYRLALVFVDLDRFKSINDRHGHHVGDKVLQAVADAMRDSMRGTDDVARMGGEEFAALLIEADRDRALQVAERLKQRVCDLGFRDDRGRLVSVTLSGGIALFPDHGSDAIALLRVADGALYAAKRRGRNEVVVGAVEELWAERA